MESGDWEIRDSKFHEHPLMLTEEKRHGPCDGCGKSLNGLIYQCRSCVFKVHKSCAELPREIQNPYHSHPLTLVTDGREGHSFRCFACLEHIPFGFTYYCGDCKFDLHVKCTLWKLSTDEGQDQLNHFTHLHPLVATEKKKLDNDVDGDDDGDDDDEVSCKICGEPCSDEIYSCDHCNFCLHRSCAKLQFPQNLQHFYHPCLLTLCFDEKGSHCKACGNFNDFYSYLCESCNFRMDISCALLPTAMESAGQRQFHHFSHGHPLKLDEINDIDDEILCSACQKPCSGQTYVCYSRKCKFSLHSSCFNLPRNVHNPFHPHHLLTLYPPIQHKSRSRCKICCRICSGFTYSCDHCEFNMDVECPVMISTIKYQGHHHNILFVDGLDPCQPDAQADDDDDHGDTLLPCSACAFWLSSSTAMFHCVECEFHLHFKCGPLPYFIKHESHLCSLKLTDSPVIVEGEDKDTDVFYCDTCEKERDPRLPIYYCSDGCAYIAEIKCVISEVLLSLRGEYGDVDLQSAFFKNKFGKVIGKGTVKGTVDLPQQDSIADNEITEAHELEVHPTLALKKIIDALPQLEKRKTKFFFVLHFYEEYPYFYEEQDHDLRLTYNGVFSCSDEDYRKFMTLMDTINEFTVFVSNWESKNKVVNLGNRLGSSHSTPIVEDLCTKYGDHIIPESILQHSWVWDIFVDTLCETIRGMCTSRVVDISEADLFIWWGNLRTLQFVGFKVEFALDRLKRVGNAYYALRVQETVKRELEEMDAEIARVSQDIDELEAKLVAQKAKVLALKERCREPSPKPAGSSMVAKCFKEASVLKWMIAGEALL